MEKQKDSFYHSNQDNIVDIQNNHYVINNPELISDRLSNNDQPHENDIGQSQTNSSKQSKNNTKKRIKKKAKLYFSSKHTAYLIVLWLIFLITFIVGFVVHFDTTKNVTASSILWTFSLVIFGFSVLYSYCYYMCSHAKTETELQKYLKYIPC